LSQGVSNIKSSFAANAKLMLECFSFRLSRSPAVEMKVTDGVLRLGFICFLIVVTECKKFDEREISGTVGIIFAPTLKTAGKLLVLSLLAEIEVPDVPALVGVRFFLTGSPVLR